MRDITIMCAALFAVLATGVTVGTSHAASVPIDKYTVKAGTVTLDCMDTLINSGAASGTVTVTILADGKAVGNQDAKIPANPWKLFTGNNRIPVPIPSFNVSVPRNASKIEVSASACVTLAGVGKDGKTCRTVTKNGTKKIGGFWIFTSRTIQYSPFTITM